VKEHGPDFEWDNANLKHVARHRVTPAEAQEVLRNDPIEVGYDVIEGEGRWTMDSDGAHQPGASAGGGMYVPKWKNTSGNRVAGPKRSREEYLRLKHFP
jgi:hypothetical protein